MDTSFSENKDSQPIPPLAPKPAHLRIFVSPTDKSKWIEAAVKSGKRLEDWVILKLNNASTESQRSTQS